MPPGMTYMPAASMTRSAAFGGNGGCDVVDAFAVDQDIRAVGWRSVTRVPLRMSSLLMSGFNLRCAHGPAFERLIGYRYVPW